MRLSQHDICAPWQSDACHGQVRSFMMQPATDLSGGEEAKHEERPLLGFVGNPYCVHAHHNLGSHRGAQRHYHRCKRIPVLSMMGIFWPPRLYHYTVGVRSATSSCSIDFRAAESDTDSKSGPLFRLRYISFSRVGLTRCLAVMKVPHDTRSTRYTMNTQWCARCIGSQGRYLPGRAIVLVYSVLLYILDTRWCG